MTNRRKYNPANKEQVMNTLRREILAARLKVTLDEQLGRETSQTVKRLSKMKLPPIVRPACPVDDVQGDTAGTSPPRCDPID